ncbi:hypothetical protein GC167_05930 [bacterium]|nr:hypothetical protein [bacterium]
MNRDLDSGLPIIGKKPDAPLVMNTDTLKASIPDLLAEIERRGVSLPQVSFDLIQSMHSHRNSRWNASNGGMRVEPDTLDETDGGSPKPCFAVIAADGKRKALFFDEADAVAFANPQFTMFERAAEVAGEIGELLNAVKKLRRHDMKMPGNYKPGEQDRDELLRRAAYELGDGFVTLFNLAGKLGINAYDCLQMAFNTKSDEMGFPEKL